MPKKDKDRFSSSLLLRFTPDQMQRLREKAHGASLPISVYIRVTLGLERRPKTKKQDAEEADRSMRGVSDDAPTEEESLGLRGVDEEPVSDLL